MSVTRFRLRSLRFLPFFMLHTNRTIAQIRRTEGFLAGAVARDAGLAFWTVTVWRDEIAMRAYGSSGAHRNAAPYLVDWGDQAHACHWRQEGRDLPDWSEAARRLRELGRPLRVKHPAQDIAEEGFAEPKLGVGMRL